MNLWRIIKQWLSDILTPVYRGEMETSGRNFGRGHLCGPEPACPYPASFLAVRWTHVPFSTDVHLCLWPYRSIFPFLLPPPLLSLPSSPLPASLPSPHFFGLGKPVPLRTVGAGLRFPSVFCSLKAVRWSREIGDLGYLEGHWTSGKSTWDWTPALLGSYLCNPEQDTESLQVSQLPLV